jgi:hypothetical protein
VYLDFFVVHIVCYFFFIYIQSIRPQVRPMVVATRVVLKLGRPFLSLLGTSKTCCILEWMDAQMMGPSLPMGLSHLPPPSGKVSTPCWRVTSTARNLYLTYTLLVLIGLPLPTPLYRFDAETRLVFLIEAEM